MTQRLPVRGFIRQIPRVREPFSNLVKNPAIYLTRAIQFSNGVHITYIYNPDGTIMINSEGAIMSESREGVVQEIIYRWVSDFATYFLEKKTIIEPQSEIENYKSSSRGLEERIIKELTPVVQEVLNKIFQDERTQEHFIYDPYTLLERFRDDVESKRNSDRYHRIGREVFTWRHWFCMVNGFINGVLMESPARIVGRIPWEPLGSYVAIQPPHVAGYFTNTSREWIN